MVRIPAVWVTVVAWQGAGGAGAPADFYKGAKACIGRRKLEKNLIRPTSLVVRPLGGQQRQEDPIKFKTLFGRTPPYPLEQSHFKGTSFYPFSTVLSSQKICTVRRGEKINQFFRGVSGN